MSQEVGDGHSSFANIYKLAKDKNGLYLDGHVGNWHDIGTLQQTPAGTNSIFEWI